MQEIKCSQQIRLNLIMNIQAQFGERVRQLRKQKKFSQEELAQETGLHRTYISDIERGNRNVSLENIKKIADALDVQLNYLLKGIN